MVKRYNPGQLGGMNERDDGEYVDADDYAALERERDELLEQLGCMKELRICGQPSPNAKRPCWRDANHYGDHADGFGEQWPGNAAAVERQIPCSGGCGRMFAVGPDDVSVLCSRCSTDQIEHRQSVVS